MTTWDSLMEGRRDGNVLELEGKMVSNEDEEPASDL